MQLATQRSQRLAHCHRGFIFSSRLTIITYYIQKKNDQVRRVSLLTDTHTYMYMCIYSIHQPLLGSQSITNLHTRSVRLFARRERPLQGAHPRTIRRILTIERRSLTDNTRLTLAMLPRLLQMRPIIRPP